MEEIKPKGITHLGFRSVLEALEEVIGRNGLNSLLRYYKLQEFIDNPLEYDSDKRIPNPTTTRLYMCVRELFGNNGYNTLMFKAGGLMVQNVIKHNEALRNLLAMDLDPFEKIKIAFSAYSTTAGYDPEKTMEHIQEKREIIIHRPGCLECEELVKHQKKSYGAKNAACALSKGVLNGVGNSFFEISASCEEIVCRISGHEECLFRIKYEIIK